MNFIRASAACRATPLTLRTIYNSGKNPTKKKLIKHTAFLHRELPIRLSHRIVDLYKLPNGLPQISHAKKVINLYKESFTRIKNIETPDTIEKSYQFNSIITDIKQRHTHLERDIGRAIQTIPEDAFIDHKLLQKQLDSFFISRIGIRTLIGHSIELHKTIDNKKPHGVIEPCSIKTIIKEASFDTNRISQYVYGLSPQINITGPDKDISIPYIPTNLHFVFYEILKNAFQSTLEYEALAQFGDIKKIEELESNKIAPINIQYSEGKDDIAIKISDKGGGFSRSKIKKIFRYSYTSNNTTDIFDDSPNNIPIMNGFGFGLPLSRIFCRYFQGYLHLIPYEGVGTDVVIYINKLHKSKERLI